jgi:signal transduction histidine kinase
VRKDGQQVFVIDVLRPMSHEGGQIYGILKVSRDITARHVTRLRLEAAQKELENIRAELERKVAHRTAAQEQTVQSLEQVLYHVAHDLRAPLRTMEGFSSILVQKYGSSGDPEARRLSDAISDSARRMDQLIHDLLAYGRLCHEPIQRSKVSLHIAVKTSLDKLESDIQKAGADIKCEEPLPSVWADPAVLHLVLCQLISNALSFVAAARKPRLRIWAESADQASTRVWIEDNGVGIAPEYLDRIFWLFERLSQESASASTGMGLPIAKKGIERMGGRIGVESNPGAGSRFWIELPSCQEGNP